MLPKNRVVGIFLRATCFHGVVSRRHMERGSCVEVIAAMQHSSMSRTQAKEALF